MDRFVRRRLDLESEARGELDRTHHPDGVFAKSKIGITDDANPAGGEILEAADVVNHREVGDVVEERVDREIAAPRILQRRAEGVVVGDEKIFGLVFGDGRTLRLATERRHFDDLVLEDDVDEPEPASDDPAVAKEPADFAGMGIGDDVEILRRPLHEEIADASSAEIRAVSAAMEAVENLEDVLGDAAAGDGVVAPVDDGARTIRRSLCRSSGDLGPDGCLSVDVRLPVFRVFSRFHVSSRLACSDSCCR
jgi:hypothetical protein